MTEASFPCAALIKEIGRGAHGARALTREQAQTLYAAILSGRVSDLELGAVLIAYRIKGESADELAGMMAAAQASIPAITPAIAGDGALPRAVSIPSYNGARKQPNLTPLLALLLARENVPVLVHGVRHDATRVTSAEIFAELGLAACASIDAISHELSAQRIAFAPIDVLSAPLARLLDLRRVLGVRNSTHTIVKLLQPFAEPGLRLVNYTHPAYRDSLAALFGSHPDAAAGDVLLARGTEGEAFSDPRRQVQIDHMHGGIMETLVSALRSEEAMSGTPGALPERDAKSTARYITDVLDEREPVPAGLARQVALITRIVSAS